MDRKKGIILTVIAITVLSLSIVGATYAYWTVTKSQTGNGSIEGGCLSFNFAEGANNINLQNAYPITDFEGMQLTPFTFTVTNNCDDPLDYNVYLDKLTGSTLNDKNIAVIFDYGIFDTYNNFETIESADSNISMRRKLADDTVLGNSTNTHYLRVWMDEATTKEQANNKTFNSKISVEGGQGIKKYYTPEECFTFTKKSGGASITGFVEDYDTSICTSNLVIPYEITDTTTGITYPVTSIGQSAFRGSNLTEPLTSVEIPRTVTTSGNNAFDACMATRVILKDGLEELKRNNFGGDGSDDLSELTFIMFPNTLKTINEMRYTKLENIIIPDSVTTFSGTMNFSNNNIKNIKIGTNPGLTRLTVSLFSDNEIQTVEVPSNIQVIEGGAFAGNPIKSVTLNEGLIEIGEAAFSNYTTSYTLGSKYLMKQDPYTVNIPSTVTIIDSDFDPAFHFDSANKGTLNLVGTPSISPSNINAVNAYITCNGVPYS